MSGCPHAGGHRSNSDLDLSSVALASPSQLAAQYEECIPNRVVNMKCERMRASTARSRFWQGVVSVSGVWGDQWNND